MQDELQRKTENWCKAEKTQAGFRRMPAPYENIYIGTDPLDGFTEEDAKKFDVILNVSDTPCALFHPARPDQRMYWFPINEIGYWGYAVFFGVKKVADFHHELKHRIYWHCHAGACRSPYTFIWWLVSRGHTIEEAVRIEWNAKTDREMDEAMAIWRRDHYIEMGMIPKNLPKMYELMKAHPTYSLGGILLKDIGGKLLDTTTDILSKGEASWARKWRRYRYFYKIKYALNDWWREFKRRVS